MDPPPVLSPGGVSCVECFMSKRAWVAKRSINNNSEETYSRRTEYNAYKIPGSLQLFGGLENKKAKRVPLSAVGSMKSNFILRSK
jgi:hypothetical protein